MAERPASDVSGGGTNFIGMSIAAIPALPAAPAAVAQRPPVEQTNPVGPRVSLAGRSVLVVDDDDDARLLVGKVLERHGARVATAASAVEALRAIDSEAFNVLLSDIGMPEQDGYALIAQVRARDADHNGAVPAAALTAFTRDEDRRRALAAGFQMHVPKPVGSSKLVGVVAELARGASV